ncbi:MAG TPA: hypothetical protein VK961_28445 [Chthoniobacter sp.]|nr:hypothetical protein [Chthoniobacter sp.]
MNILRTTILGVVALGGFALATPAQARDHHYYGRSYGHSYYRSGPRVGVTFGSPYYYSQRPYYYSYSEPYYGYSQPYYTYSRPYYGYGPGVSFAFGGHRGYYYHSSHGHHHHH